MHYQFLFRIFTSLIQLLPPKDSPVEFTYANTINLPSSLVEIKTVLPKFKWPFKVLHPIYNTYFEAAFWGSTIAENSIFLKIFYFFFIFVVVNLLNYLKNKPSALFFYLSSSSIFLFFLIKFTGSIRHHGFYFIVWYCIMDF